MKIVAGCRNYQDAQRTVIVLFRSTKQC